MPSSQKTTNLGLNKWQPSDIPKRADFLADNELLDAAIGQLRQQPSGGGGGNDPRLEEHLADDAAHLSDANRTVLAKALPIVGSYTGNGNLYQNIATGFPPRVGFVFAAGVSPVEPTPAGTSQHIRFGILGENLCTVGLQALTTGFRASQLDGGTGSGKTHIELNANGVTYCYILWK